MAIVQGGIVTESILFFSGSVVTFDDSAPAATAVLVRDGLIAAVGGDVELREYAAGMGATEVDLRGAALLPGFVDAHHHFLFGALGRRSPDLHQLPAGSGIRDGLGLVEHHVLNTPGTGWVRLFGYSPLDLREHRHPARRELDEICPDRPLLVIALGMHSGALNSAGFDAMGWLPPRSIPAGGRIPLGRNGLPRGTVTDAALYLAEATSRGSQVTSGGDAWLIEARSHAQDLAAAGITRVGDAAVSPEFDVLYQRAVAGGTLPITVHRMPIATQSLMTPRTTGPATGCGPARSPVGAAKLFLDGGEDCAVCLSIRESVHMLGRLVTLSRGGHGLAAIRAAMSGRIARPRGDLKLRHGTLFWERHALESAITTAAEFGLQTAQHALGNAAIDQATRALDAVHHRIDALPGRPRIEHALFCGPTLAARVAGVGAVAVVSPIWFEELGASFRAAASLMPDLPPMPLRTLIDAGVILAGSSDYPSADYRVLPAVQAAVTRTVAGGEQYAPQEAITTEQALRAYTMGSATALAVADTVGSITVGKQADLVILDTNPLGVDPSDIASIQVLVSEHARVDDVGQVPFQRAQGFFRGLSGCSSGVVVGAACGEVA
ncbi:amidohydrolase [Nocardia yunnanensis]|uniref:amidohydrolase n=1 Tax=Nocardia yunnanensis TaxID=2382165 RepID=UPI0013C50F40|nr:amidohydrolase family protein [Nocardia yunnanensis]